MGLTGAAATSAGLAFLGGGAIAAGGLGMAGGTMFLIGGGALLGTRVGTQMIKSMKENPELLLQQLAKLEAITKGIFAQDPEATELRGLVRQEVKRLLDESLPGKPLEKNRELIQRAHQRLRG